MKNKLASAIAISLLMVIILIPLFIYALLYGGGLLHLGIAYDKISHFCLFVLLNVTAGIILGPVINAIPQALFDFKLLRRKQAALLDAALEFSSSLLILSAIDHFMDTVAVSFSTTLLFSLFVSGVGFFISKAEPEIETSDISPTLSKKVAKLLSEHNLLDTIKIMRSNHPELSLSKVKQIVQQVSHGNE